ncbi:3-methyl-2-oxobutanoate hydroxymethyltransferase [Lentisphaerota bacterium ZTH]|nr:3-methyl-2-oxobutanoate hydroxymethyltransferase [Lentisphaerota bacterium]WET06755.1 3-methyl-2-oxobutanoate hydroxymethyltransferase [Lentisphaerota bacterium ZTH]
MSRKAKKTVCSFRNMKRDGEKIVMLTTYDAPSGRLAEEAGVDILLVGDSLAMTVLGYENTLPLTLEESLHHCRAVRRGAPNSFIVGDMPFMTYQASESEALKNAARYLKEAGCNAVKVEGGMQMIPLFAKMVQAGIPVMGHIGLLPQQVLTAGGYKVAGRTEEDADRLMAEALALEEAGAFCIVLECLPATVSKRIAETVAVPTIGIGAGPHCDGQVQVFLDILGMFDGFKPKHAKRYANLAGDVHQALSSYCQEVREKKFPTEEHSF